MAKYEAELHGDFFEILEAVDDAVMSNSASATLEDKSDFCTQNMICAVRVYERYSYSGGNRVSMNITLLKSDERTFITVITAGGSQSMFLKVNTFGEKLFSTPLSPRLKDTKFKFIILIFLYLFDNIFLTLYSAKGGCICTL